MRIIRDYKWVFDDVEIGIRVRQRRVMLGLTQAEVGTLVGMESPGVITALENGRYSDGITVRTLLAITNWLDIDPAVAFQLQVED